MKEIKKISTDLIGFYRSSSGEIKAFPKDWDGTKPKDAESGGVYKVISINMGKYKVKQAKDGKYYFILYAANGAILVKSQYYASLAGCDSGLESVKRNYDSPVIDETNE